MASTKEGAGKSLRDRLKNFLTSQKPQTTLPSGNKQEDINISDDFWISIAPTSTAEARIDSLKGMEKTIESKQLEHGILEKLWMQSKDLLKPTVSETVRSDYFSFLQHLVLHQYRNLGLLKAALYDELISPEYAKPGDMLNILLVVDALSDHGKHLQFLEHEVSC